MRTACTSIAKKPLPSPEIECAFECKIHLEHFAGSSDFSGE